MFRDDDCNIFWYKLYEFLVPLIAAAIFYREPSFKSGCAGGLRVSRAKSQGELSLFKWRSHELN